MIDDTPSITQIDYNLIDIVTWSQLQRSICLRLE